MSEGNAQGGFAASNDRWSYAGPLTFANAARAFSAARAMPLPASGVVDFSGLTQADSAALAMAIALKRRAAAEGRHVELTAIPATLTTLAIAYGVEELIAA